MHTHTHTLTQWFCIQCVNDKPPCTLCVDEQHVSHTHTHTHPFPPRSRFVVLARDAAEAAAASAIPGILVCTLPPESRVPPSYGPAGVFYDCFARVALSLASPDLRGFLLIHDGARARGRVYVCTRVCA